MGPNKVSPASTSNGLATTPGITRIDLNSTQTGCNTVWTNNNLAVPSVVSQASLSNGWVYTYAKNAGPGTTDAWYFAALSFETGATVWQQLAGTGVGYNNNFSGLIVSPDGKSLYTGALGEVVRMTDSNSTPCRN